LWSGRNGKYGRERVCPHGTASTLGALDWLLCAASSMLEHVGQMQRVSATPPAQLHIAPRAE
jgi:hypothetical protein